MESTISYSWSHAFGTDLIDCNYFATFIRYKLVRFEKIASKIGKKAFNEKMFDLVIACLADHVFSIRDAACRTLQRIVDIFGLDWAKQIVMPKVFQLAEEKNYLRRMTMLFQINYLMNSTLKEKVFHLSTLTETNVVDLGWNRGTLLPTSLYIA